MALNFVIWENDSNPYICLVAPASTFEAMEIGLAGMKLYHPIGRL
jgi:hypothetical protein